MRSAPSTSTTARIQPSGQLSAQRISFLESVTVSESRGTPFDLDETKRRVSALASSLWDGRLDVVADLSLGAYVAGVVSQLALDGSDRIHCTQLNLATGVSISNGIF